MTPLKLRKNTDRSEKKRSKLDFYDMAKAIGFIDFYVLHFVIFADFHSLSFLFVLDPCKVEFKTKSKSV